MRKLKYSTLLVLIAISLSFSCGGLLLNKRNDASLTSFVDPFIGTDFHGHTFPGATLPFGMVQLSPDTRTLGWERYHAGWSGGDQCSDQTIGHTGFTGTGLWVDFGSGTAWPLLTNRIPPTRHADSGIVQLRRDVSNAINAAGE